MRKGIGRLGPGVRVVLPVALGLALVTAINAAQYVVNDADSQSLTAYLRQHRLPLVGAQVLGDGSGNRRIVLYGFVASQFGKRDAERKALAYVEGGGNAASKPPEVENRIEVRPEIARMKTHHPSASAADAGNESLDHVLDDIDRYGVTMAPDQPSPK